MTSSADLPPDTFFCTALPVGGASGGAPALCEKLNAHVRRLTSEHVWQSQPLRFEVQGAAVSATQHYGDAVEDEWLSTWVVRDFSLLDSSVVFCLLDSDGSFLATEAAEALPPWLEPDSSEHRVYVFQGDVHIIPSPRDPLATPAACLASVPTMDGGAAWVWRHAAHTRASDAVQAAVARRIGGYPQRMAASLHVARMYVPVMAAHLLRSCPHLAAQAAVAFYTRDPIEVSTASRLRVLSPTLAVRAGAPGADAATRRVAPLVTASPPELVAVSVRLTRCLFAQLGQQRFHPPRPYVAAVPPGVAAAGGLPPPYSLGARLTVGLEILLLRGGGRGLGCALPAAPAPLAVLRAAGWPGLPPQLDDSDPSSLTPAEDALAAVAAEGGAAFPGGGVVAALLGDASWLAGCAGTPLPAADRDDDTAWLQDEEAAEAELAAVHSRLTGLGAAGGLGGASLANSGDAEVIDRGRAGGGGEVALESILAGLGSFLSRSSDVEGVQPGPATSVASVAAGSSPQQLGGLAEEEDGEDDDEGSEEEEEGEENAAEGDVEDEADNREGGGGAEVLAELVPPSLSTGHGVLAVTVNTDRGVLLALLALHAEYAGLGEDGPVGARSRSTLDARLSALLGADPPSLRDVMAAMDEQLYGPKQGDDDDGGNDTPSAGPPPLLGGQSFVRLPPDGAGLTGPGGSLSDADVGHNLVSSLGTSVGGQLGGPGPASNLLGYLGLPVPHAWWAAKGDTPGDPSGGAAAAGASTVRDPNALRQLSQLD